MESPLELLIMQHSYSKTGVQFPSREFRNRQVPLQQFIASENLNDAETGM